MIRDATHLAYELTAYLDGALDPAARAEVETHLASCAACRAERDQLAGALQLMKRLPSAPAPSPQFAPRFYERLENERSPLRRALDRVFEVFFPTGWQVAAASGTAAVAIVVALSISQSRRHESEMAENLELFENYELVASIDSVEAEDAEVVASLHELGVRR